MTAMQTNRSSDHLGTGPEITDRRRKFAHFVCSKSGNHSTQSTGLTMSRV